MTRIRSSALRFGMATVLAATSVAALAGDAADVVPKKDLACGSKSAKEAVAIDHYLFFPTEADARAAAGRFDLKAFRLQVRTAETQPGWVLYLVHLTPLDDEGVRRTESWLKSMAVEHGGKYGWYSCQMRSVRPPAKPR